MFCFNFPHYPGRTLGLLFPEGEANKIKPPGHLGLPGAHKIAGSMFELHPMPLLKLGSQPQETLVLSHKFSHACSTAVHVSSSNFRHFVVRGFQDI